MVLTKVSASRSDESYLSTCKGTKYWRSYLLIYVCVMYYLSIFFQIVWHQDTRKKSPSVWLAGHIFLTQIAVTNTFRKIKTGQTLEPFACRSMKAKETWSLYLTSSRMTSWPHYPAQDPGLEQVTLCTRGTGGGTMEQLGDTNPGPPMNPTMPDMTKTMLS